MKTQNIEEKILDICFNSDPTHRSPYSLYGNPPMWDVGERDGVVYTVRYASTTIGTSFGYQFVAGYVLEKIDASSGKLIGQAVSTPCHYYNHDPILLELLAAK